ncbi:berberine bridge enzyme-like Cyn d 4 [Hordeum vulgare subsp. vulgare]|uniref:FAD-binding PCMH-type domain-containing protein n=1 Tax=Hordeum vulgare subsp. vulgare TaxID=112509 RepID=A0A8I6WL72_HORVV|nr:berberine bridge enzyme-like Cyn d 4 [Hordeum vulgare subsp. vulgare]
MGMLRGLALAFSVSFFSCYLAMVSSDVASSDSDGDGFLQCLREKIPRELVYTQSSSNFTDVLVSSIKNPRFFTNATARPLCIVTPGDASHVQAAVVCGRMQGVRLRVRSGGHDYEGLSYRSARPSEVFAVVDVGASLRAVRVNRLESTAWVDSGATIGELYYAIAKNDSLVAFPAGECTTVGVGGHFSGGGIGMMMRKHGLAVDRIVDAKLVNADGDLLDRAGMGEDLFWAIRGGGGGSFGVVLSWKVQLVNVPPTVTVFNIGKTVDQGAVDILTRWQDVAPSLPSDLTIRVIVQQGQQALFQGQYLGACGALVETMGEQFPELGMTSADCQQMTWLQSAATPFISFSSNGTLEEVLLNRTASLSTSTKGKSDYVRRAITKAAWEEIFSRWFAMDGAGRLILEPHGGFMDTIPAAATPYPHRNGVLYVIQYMAFWQQQGEGGAAAKSWIGGLYDFMGQHVSKNPRRAYVNFRDLDIGQNDDDGTFDFENGPLWGERYFVGNYRRLASVKSVVDPTNYFRNEQSIPPLIETTTQVM